MTAHTRRSVVTVDKGFALYVGAHEGIDRQSLKDSSVGAVVVVKVLHSILLRKPE